jgi:hypothetical protein
MERPAGPGAAPGTVARLSVRLEPGPNGAGPTPAELKEAMESLAADLDALVGPLLAAAPIARPDREVRELVEAYRPRQRVLVDLLRDEGEITAVEHERLVAYLVGSPATVPAPEPAEIPTDRPLAAVPISATPAGPERSLPAARPIPELLRTYQIASLRQAGAVRARRQISFAEYMALKRYFQDLETEPRPAPEDASR